MISALALILALQAPIYVGGQFTDSQTTVATPVAHQGATHAIVSLNARSRYFAGWETDFVTFEGVGGCAWTSRGFVRQHLTVNSNGEKLVGGRTAFPFDVGGQCVPFDGVNDFAGESGGSSGFVWRAMRMAVMVPIHELGDTITVDADGGTVWDQTITCSGLVPYDVQGSVSWINASWWDGELSVRFVP